MRVDPATLGLVFSAVSTLVIIIGALAAVRQLQHLRRGNELEAIGKFVDEWNSQDFASDRDFVLNELNKRVANPAFVRDTPRDHPDLRRANRVANFFERIAIFVNRDALSKDLAMLLFAEAAKLHWSAVRAYVVQNRERTGEASIAEYFEDFALSAPDWQRRDSARSKRLLRDPNAITPGVPAGEP
jgi:hypothetical protein